MKENILCAAIWHKEVVPRATHRPINTPGGVVLCGFRHGDCISQVLSLTGERQFKLGEHIQGFLTNKKDKRGKIFTQRNSRFRTCIM